MNAHHLAKVLGGTALGSTVTAPGPGHSAHDRSMSVKIDRDAPDGFLVHSFAGDDPLACKDYVREKVGPGHFEPKRRVRPPVSSDGFVSISAAAPRVVASTAEAATRRARALTLWSEAMPPQGTIVTSHYLPSRSLDLPDDVLAADVIRFHPRCPFRMKAGPRKGETMRLPTMVALMRDVRDDLPVAIHRTPLRPDGSARLYKADMPDCEDGKRMLGLAGGAAVKLISDADVTLGLGIAEGIETALTAICAGWRPVWAAGSAGAIKAFPVLGGIEMLTIFADADANGTGLRDARACAARWADAGIEARIILPSTGDWNDVHQAEGTSY